MPPLGERAVTKSVRERKNVCSHFAINAGNGIRAISGRSSGTFLTRVFIPARVCECFRFRIGRNSMFGNTFMLKTFRLFRFTLLSRA